MEKGRISNSESVSDSFRFAVADAETDPFIYGRIPVPFLWGVYDGKRFFTFTDTRKFAAWLHDFDGVVYAHNGGKFDWHYVLDFLYPHTELLIINGRLSRFQFGKAECRDSYNIIPEKLSEYKKDEIDYRLFEKSEREKPQNWRKIVNYLRGDCVYTYQMIEGFIQRHGVKLTQAGASMAAYEKLLGTKCPQSTPEYFDQFRPYYYGGRVEASILGRGKIDFSVYDINSAYPWAMCEGKHPATLQVSRRRSGIELATFVNDHPQSVIDITCVSDGAFPWREQVGKRIDYPRDKNIRDYLVTGHEVRVALKYGKLDKVKKWNGYYWPICLDFSSYLLPIYEARKEAKARGDKLTALLDKLQMNSLYGKFGADPRRYKRYVNFETEEFAGLLRGLRLGGHKYVNAGMLGGWLLGETETKQYEQRFYNVATALSITGRVRAHLFEAEQHCERVLYKDTDSIAVHGDCEVPVSHDLGDWKCEGHFDEYAIAGRKLYAFHHIDGETDEDGGAWKVRSKGVHLTAEQVCVVASGRVVSYQFDAPSFSVSRKPSFIRRNVSKQKY